MTTHLTQDGYQDDVFADELSVGTPLLRGQYVIEAYLNSGGFGITYLAKDSLHRRVVIKECFPTEFCRRSDAVVGVRSRTHAGEFRSIVKLFVQEARSLARLTHPNIVGVHQVFEDNDTAYMALDYVDGRDLLDIIHDPNSKLEPEAVEELLRKLLHAVQFIHGEGVLHRDISPDNILVKEDGEPVLIDFGAARESAVKKSRALSALRVVKDGYSPQEFYVSTGDQYPCSDLYALSATIYHLVTGEAPPNAQHRLAAVAANEPDPYVPAAVRARGYNRTFLKALDKALHVFPRERIQTAADWLALLDRAPQVSVPAPKAVSHNPARQNAVDVQLDTQIQSIMENAGLGNSAEEGSSQATEHKTSAREDISKAESAVSAGEPEDRNRLAEPAKPRRPERNEAKSKRQSERPKLPTLEAVDVDEPPAISLDEALAERRRIKSVQNRSVAAMFVTLAVIWLQFGSWTAEEGASRWQLSSLLGTENSLVRGSTETKVN